MGIINPLASVVMIAQDRSHCPFSGFFQGSHSPAIGMILATVRTP
jgi:hypothetical protein